jgi:carboxynorspermidine decarboxylase
MPSLAPVHSQCLHTPAFVYDEIALVNKCEKWKVLCNELGIHQFFPVKCHNLLGSLEIITKYVNGFAVSSLFEAQLAREVLGDAKKVHFTSPSLRQEDSEGLLSLCDGISFNSLPQWTRFKNKVSSRVTCGLRVNPQLPFINDARYNPCRPHSRLGAPLEQIEQAIASTPELLRGIEGIHFHTNCDATDWSPLKKTVQHLDTHIPSLVQQCRWMNMGGGYLLDNNTDLNPFHEAIDILQSKYDLEVIIEPGAGVVRDACFLVAQVVDLFESEGVQLAVLDTTVNHMPEVFEYQFSPDVEGDTTEGQYCYVLTGATCLAGDVFGEYAFDNPLAIGSTVTFNSVGAYTLVKSNMFNGIDLPTIYALTSTGELILQKQFNYEDFRQRWEPKKHDESARNVVENPRGIRQRRSA